MRNKIIFFSADKIINFSTSSFVITEQPTHIYGDSLKQQVEDRLKFYESGETPRKNIEVMKEAMDLVAQETPSAVSEKKKKKKKRKLDESQNGSVLNDTNGGDTTMELNGTIENGNGTENGEGKKKKKKKKNKSQDD